MAKVKTAVFGIYASRSNAESAIRTLMTSGFQAEDFSILFPDDQRGTEIAIEKTSKAPEGAAAGVGTGAVAGGILGLFAGTGSTLAAAMIAIPGIGPFMAAGPIIAALAGAGIGGAIGGVTGALVGMGIPEYEAKKYEGHIAKGGILLSVHCDSAEEIENARTGMEQTGASDISWTQESAADSASSDRPKSRSASSESE